MTNITDTQYEELEQFIKSIEGTLNQFFIDTSDFTLERWERKIGIPVNNSKSEGHRKSAIKSKLKGSGTVTITLIENVASSYNNGEVQVIEDNTNYQFILKFIANDGAPQNLTDLKQAIEDIKPAHLGVIYEYKYITWDKLDLRNVTWDYLDSLNVMWNNFEIGEWS